MSSRLIILCSAIALLFVLGLALSLIQPSEQEETVGETNRWPLPAALSEASGLAILNNQTLVTHNDEFGVVYRLSLDHQIVEPLVDLSVAADFEGIALTPTDLYLTTSKGTLYHIPDFDLSDQSAESNKIKTGVKKVCEIEGLHFDKGELLLPCKTALTKAHENHLVVFAWHLENETLSERLKIPLKNTGKLKPTAIDVHEGTYYLLASGKLVIVDANLSIETHGLSKARHPQPEGLSVFEDGSIVIVDDVKKGRSFVTRYAGLAELNQLNR